MTGSNRTAGAVLVILLLAGGALWAQSEQDVTFNWAFVKQQEDSGPGLIDFSGRIRIAPGDLFKIFVQPVRDAHVYLYLHDAQGELSLLFPADFEEFEDPYYFGRKVFIPDGDTWFTLDDTRGVERFYLLAAPERLAELEADTLTFLEIHNDRKSSPERIATARQRVLDRIALIRQQYSQFNIAAEKPVPIAGGVRGRNEAIEKLAIQISSQGFYTRTFRLEHPR
ncbi:MAG: DUF4384 domain-containing protein [Spirochaetales bacterium]|nr:DUF4384 domain-containing protein [Spirochaetales bacterium]